MTDSPTVGLKRQRSSPGDSAPTSKKISLTDLTMEKMDTSQLVSLIKEVMSGLLDDKLAPLATKVEFSALRDDIISLKEENAQLKAELEAIKSMNILTESRVEGVEIASRRNNLIFKGIKHSSTDDLSVKISDFCREVLKLDISVEHLYVFPLGSRDKVNKPILVSFSCIQHKLMVLNSAKILRGTGFVIHEDLPEVTRKKKTKLLLLRREILRLNRDIKVKVRSDCLMVEGCKFVWSSRDGLCCAGQDGVRKLNELIGGNLSDFVSALRSDSLPKDYFARVAHQASKVTPDLSSSVRRGTS